MSNSSEIQQIPKRLLGSLCCCLYGSPENSPYIWKRGSGCAPVITHGYGQLSGGAIFRTRPYRPWGQPSLLYNGYRVIPGGKAIGAWRWTPTPSSAEVKERVELYFYSPLGLRGLLWVNFTFTFTFMFSSRFQKKRHTSVHIFWV
jgi:hypothetical protein